MSNVKNSILLFNIVKLEVPTESADVLDEMKAEGFTLKRKWYIYEELRPQCVDPENGDKFMQTT